MSNVFFISDLHLGHKNITKFEGPYRGGTTTVEEHDAWIIEQWNSVVRKQDMVWVLGDVAFEGALPKIALLNGIKHLILGNHDDKPITEYLKYFNKVHGFMKKYGFWMSHAPLHPGSLRNKPNVHGHLHHGVVRKGLFRRPDPRYLCVSVEHLQGKPMPLFEVRQRLGLTSKPGG